jgi:hypothetical protein
MHLQQMVVESHGCEMRVMGQMQIYVNDECLVVVDELSYVMILHEPHKKYVMEQIMTVMVKLTKMLKLRIIKIVIMMDMVILRLLYRHVVLLHDMLQTIQIVMIQMRE